MGHLIFIILHCAALFFTGCVGLIFTIPLHVIYCAIKSNNPTNPTTIQKVKQNQENLEQWAINKEKNKQFYKDYTITNVAVKMAFYFMCILIIVAIVAILMPN